MRTTSAPRFAGFASKALNLLLENSHAPEYSDRPFRIQGKPERAGRDRAIAKAGRLLVKATEEVMRMVRVGARLAPRQIRRGAKPAGHRAKLTRFPLRSSGKNRTRTRVGLAVANPC